MRINIRARWSAVLLVAASGCASGSSGGFQAPCPSGDTRACVGPGACMGGQTCEPGGVWGTCVCSDGTGGSTGAGDGGASTGPASPAGSSDASAGTDGPPPGDDAGWSVPPGATGSDGSAASGLTFFVWSDIHVADGSNSDPASYGQYWLDAKNAAYEMITQTYPGGAGGTVGPPAFLLDCGDSVDWPTQTNTDDYATIYHDMLTSTPSIPIHAVLGNHDLTAPAGTATIAIPPTYENFYLRTFTKSGVQLPPSNTTGATVAQRSYSFLYDGIAFVGLSHSFDVLANQPSQPIYPQDLAWLDSEFAKYDAATPIVLWLHMGHDAITNLAEFVGHFAGHKVALVIGGHFHYMSHHLDMGYVFIHTGSPRPAATPGGATPTQVVVHIQDKNVLIGWWDYHQHTWADSISYTIP